MMASDRSQAFNHPSTPKYRPTSLDFINRPNPVEPSYLRGHVDLSVSGRQGAAHTSEDVFRLDLSSWPRESVQDVAKASQLARASGQSSSLAAVLNDNEIGLSSERGHTSGRRTDGDQNLLTLPQLPVKRGTKRPRQRVPPVLQGLHHPPPNSGILPSISAGPDCAAANVGKVSNISNVTQTARATIAKESESSTCTTDVRCESDGVSVKRRRWTESETRDLLNGVTRFGIGNWQKVLTCPDYSFDRRTATDLKDRFRVCCRQSRSEAAKTSTEDAEHDQDKKSSSIPIGISRGTEHVDISKLPSSTRRRRTKWEPDEDQAILTGFRKYGPSWSSIQLNPLLRARKPTDLRDRFRTRFPDEFQKAGKAVKALKPTTRSVKRSSAPRAELKQSISKPVEDSARPNAQPEGTTSKAKATNSMFPMIDDSWLLDLELPDDGFEDDDDVSTDPVILDRSIVDWANRQLQLPSLPSILSTPGFDPGAGQGIDPLATILPKPGI